NKARIARRPKTRRLREISVVLGAAHRAIQPIGGLNRRFNLIASFSNPSDRRRLSAPLRGLPVAATSHSQILAGSTQGLSGAEVNVRSLPTHQNRPIKNLVGLLVLVPNPG